jgi:hypothetical protein
MANTFTLIASSTVGAGGTASFDFTSIPATYTDLVIKISARGTNASLYSSVKVEFNGSSSNLSCKQIFGDGASAASSLSATQILFDSDGGNSTSNVFGSHEIYIPNYLGSSNKSVSIDSVSEQNGTTAYAEFVAGLWANTSAINRVTLTTISGNLAQYSTAYLYGIKNS